MSYLSSVKDQTRRSLWSLYNVAACIPDEHWETMFGGMPLWKHVYHTIHSLDRWYINPFDYSEPDFHTNGLNDLNINAGETLSRPLLNDYLHQVDKKITDYLNSLTSEELLKKPNGCPYSRFHLILAQHRHIDMHIGMLMGFILADTGKWPRVMGLEDELHEYREPEYFR